MSLKNFQEIRYNTYRSKGLEKFYSGMIFSRSLTETIPMENTGNPET